MKKLFGISLSATAALAAIALLASPVAAETSSHKGYKAAPQKAEESYRHDRRGADRDRRHVSRPAPVVVHHYPVPVRPAPVVVHRYPEPPLNVLLGRLIGAALDVPYRPYRHSVAAPAPRAPYGHGHPYGKWR